MGQDHSRQGNSSYNDPLLGESTARLRNQDKANEAGAGRPRGAEGRMRSARQTDLTRQALHTTSWILAFSLRLMGPIRDPSIIPVEQQD